MYISWKFMLILVVLLALPVSAEPPAPTKALPTPNAAVGYLMAIGWMNQAPDSVQTEFSNTQTLADLEKLSPEAKKAIGEGRLKTVVKLLISGAECDSCLFGYERTYRPDDTVPPFRRLRDLARLARVYALEQLRLGKTADAFATQKAIFRLGGHLEFDGTLISGMVGLAIKELALKGFEELIGQGKDEKTVAALRGFLKQQPKATLATKAYLDGEKKFLAAALGMIKGGLKTDTDEDLRKSWENLKFLLPKKAGVSEPKAEPAVSSPLKACQANQRVLAGATEMLCMDYSPMPATLTVAVIPEFLVSSQYLKAFPVCPAGGKYELSASKEGNYDWRCTVHPGPDADTEADAAVPPADAEIKEYKAFVGSPQFDQWTEEALATLEEAKTLDPYAPDFKTRLGAYQKKIETTDNSIIRNSLPDLEKVFEKQLQLDETVTKILAR